MSVAPRSYRQALAMVGGAIKVCDAKKHYMTRGDALRCADGAFKFQGLILTPYRCQVCDEWHLTSQTRPDERNKMVDRGASKSLARITNV